MAVTPLVYDDIVDIRWNPFLNGGAGDFEPLAIGWGANPTENRDIPAAAPYIIKLYETPQQNAPSTTRITIGGSELTEVGQAVTPGNLQYRVIYYDLLGAGMVEFNAAQAGQEVAIQYYGLGHGFQKISLDTRVPSTGNTAIAGIKTFSSSPVFNAGSQRGELGTALKERVVPIGNWNMDTTGQFNVAHGLGIGNNFKKIRGAQIIIYNDADTQLHNLNRTTGTGSPGETWGSWTAINSTNITLQRTLAADLTGTNGFDSANYGAGAPGGNRGYVYFIYEPI